MQEEPQGERGHYIYGLPTNLEVAGAVIEEVEVADWWR